MRILNHLAGVSLASLLALPAVADTVTVPTAAEAGTRAVTFDDTTEAASWQMLIDQIFTVPYGYSFTPLYVFDRPVPVEALRARLFYFVGEVCGATIAAVDVATAPNQRALTRLTPGANGEMAFPGNNLYQISFLFSQPLAYGGRCILRNEGLIDDGGAQDDPAPRDYQLAGVINYAGGFRSQELVSFFASERVASFWVRIPSFCTDLEVLEAGVVTEGFYDRARLVDATRNIFEVNGGAGSRARAISVSLNGPTGLECDVPVYFKRPTR